MLKELYMQRCLDLAGLGFPAIMPNPVVGAVLVYQDKIIEEGYHHYFGGPHAEVEAINSVANKEFLKDSTLYVNLEPCTHYGKTPPCVDLIIQYKIPRVVIASLDPNETVHYKGVLKLKEAGVQVTIDILKESAIHLNKRFFTFHSKRRPYIILKWAQTADGFIADENHNSKWISNTHSRLLVHQWRSEEMAILVGTNTVKYDNPLLTNRDWSGKNPLRVIIDKDLTIPANSNIFNNHSKTLVFNAIKDDILDNITWISIKPWKEIAPKILDKLYEMQILSVLIEGGAITLQSFIDANLWDEARLFTSPKTYSEGIKSPVINSGFSDELLIGDDRLLFYSNL